MSYTPPQWSPLAKIPSPITWTLKTYMVSIIPILLYSVVVSTARNEFNFFYSIDPSRLSLAIAVTIYFLNNRLLDFISQMTPGEDSSDAKRLSSTLVIYFGTMIGLFIIYAYIYNSDSDSSTLKLFGVIIYASIVISGAHLSIARTSFKF